MADRLLRLFMCGCICLGPAAAMRADDVHPAAASVQRLLNSGFQEKAVPLADLHRAYQQESTALGSNDPYLDYAYGLVLVKNFQQGDAEQALRSAAASDHPVVLPAREELIRLRLREGKHREALEMLVALAETVGDLPAEGLTGADARVTAGWIGRMIVFLEGPLGQEKIAQEARTTDAAIRRLLGDGYIPAYETGRHETAQSQRNLVKQLVEAYGRAEQAKADAAAQTRQQVQELDEQREKLTESAEEIKEVFGEKLADVDARLALFEKQFAASLAAEQRLLASQAVLQQEIQRLRLQLELLDQQPGLQNRMNRLRIEEQIGVRQNELALWVNEHAILLQSRQTLAQQAQRLLAHRQSVAGTAQTAVGGVREKMALMNRWQSRLETVAKQTAATPIDKTREVATLRRQMMDLNTYDRRDFGEQRERLISLLGAKPE